jgi:hypothetical protein
MFDSKPNTTAAGAVPGTAITPQNTGERRTFHYIENIFDPDKHPIDDLHKYVVPQENEAVFDIDQGVIYRASHVDWQATLKTTLVPWRLTNVDEGNTTEQDWIFGLRGGPLLGEALLSIDYSVRPNVARVDSTIMRPGAGYAKLFVGNDASANGKIISAQYDTSLNLLTNKVPTKLAEIVDRTNESIMTTGSFSVTENEEGLPDGTRCTLVFYDEGGEFIPPVQPVMVQHCAYMRDHQIGIKYVTEVKLISPWFTNTSDPDRLIVPMNIQLLAVELRAAVYYSDGSTQIWPVNGTKFNLYGLQEHRPTWPGQSTEISLIYTLADDEQHYIAKPGSPKHATHSYMLQSGDAIGAYSPKIYSYPQWDTATAGYVLKHWLFDLDRKTRTDVTDLVTLNDQSPPFRPTSYGVSQSMIFNLNLRDVSNIYESVVFIQHTGITLYKNVNGPGKRWDVNFSNDMPAFGGKSIVVKNNGVNTTFDVSQGQRDLVDWLDELYWSIKPAYSPRNEDKAPTPTHFDLMDDTGRKWRFAVGDYNKENPINIQLQKGKTWFISWINKAASGAELQLGLTGLVVELFV